MDISSVIVLWWGESTGDRYALYKLLNKNAKGRRCEIHVTSLRCVADNQPEFIPVTWLTIKTDTVFKCNQHFETFVL